MKNNDFFHGVFKGKVVLVTGHTGFIGTWLSLWLHLLGAKVVGYSLGPPTKPSIFETVNLEKQVIDTRGDIRDMKQILSVISKYEPQFVFHLAAQPLVLQSYEKPVDTFETNVIGTLNLFESIRKVSSVKACVNFTSDKCYENREIDHSYKEDDPLGGFDPYSASKSSSEIITSCYRKSFFEQKITAGNKISLASVRAGNVIGGGDWAENRIVPDVIKGLLAEKIVEVRNPDSVRPWQHVLEPLSGLLWLATRMWESPENFNQAWNFGPNAPFTTVKDLVNQAIEQWGKGQWNDVSHRNSRLPREAGLLKLDCSKAKNLLKWSPIYTMTKSISETVSWYKSYAIGKVNMNKFTTQQIENYCIAAKQVYAPWIEK